MTVSTWPSDEGNPDDVQAAERLDELVKAVQSGDESQVDRLLLESTELREWVGCLRDLDRFAPEPEVSADSNRATSFALRPGPSPASGPDAPELAETLIRHEAGKESRGRATKTVSGQFGKYDLLNELGRGGMGVVYRARERDLNRIVALKMILASEWATADEISRFQSEARAAARFRHRNIVGIYEVGEEGGRHYFAMDFVEGQNLSSVIAQRPLAPEQAARWMVSIAQAVEHLHLQGVIHRDLKPSNILIDGDGEPMVTDFGLAKFFDADGGATRTGAILGTPSYMSPEQASGRNSLVGIRSDVYSLGAMLYEMLSGRPPFREENPLDTLVQVLEGEPTLLRQIVRGIPRALELICFKCLEKDPARRYGSAGELAADLKRFLQGETVEAQAAGLPQIIQRWVRRQPGLACRLAVLLPVLVIVQVYFMSNGTDLSYHLRVVSLLGLWLALSIVWQRLLNYDPLATVSRLGTMLTDASILTSLFADANDDDGTLVIVYALLIVASGLWFQERLVWCSTVTSIVSFGVLLICRPHLLTPWHYPMMVVITLLAVGAATGFQVHRVRALSQFYERRPL